MFNKALFKQSCKANGTMWTIITFAVCFMLACVMLISGGGNISEIRYAVQDSIVEKSIDSQIEIRAINYYYRQVEGMKRFDQLFATKFEEEAEKAMLDPTELMTKGTELAQAKTNEWTTECKETTEYKENIETWTKEGQQEAVSSGLSDSTQIAAYVEDYVTDQATTYITNYVQAKTAEYVTNYVQAQVAQSAATTATTYAISTLSAEILKEMQDANPSANYTADSTDYKEALGATLYAIVPTTDSYADYKADYKTLMSADCTSYVNEEYISNIISGNNSTEYINSEEHLTEIADRAEIYAAVFIAHNMTQKENIDSMLKALESYKIDKEKYNSFGYNLSGIYDMARNINITFRHRYEYEANIILAKYNGDTSSADYKKEIKALSATDGELIQDIAGTFLSTLPSTVSDALEEVGKLDLYTLVVGSIFYKLAGLLLPIIYMIMASTNLVSGQVDSGSMAYVLSTSTKRKTVVFTQGCFLIGSLFAMFSLTTITGCICLAIVKADVDLTYGKLILLNLGAFLVLLALSGLCFFTSCVFDRSKRSMSIGGGLSIYALVAAMLGLFGSPVIPSIVRLKALNSFNYTTIIALFDVISIMDGTTNFIWKFVILGVLGIIGYIAGSVIFTKKDLPL